MGKVSTKQKHIKYMYNGVTVHSLFDAEHKYARCMIRYKQGMDMKDAIESVLKGVDNRKHNHRQFVYYYKEKPIGEVFKELNDREYFRQKVRKGATPEQAYKMTKKNIRRRKRMWENYYKSKENEQGISAKSI